MNSELTHRLIGAIVVTALAAIFIPMLFDDPVDTGAQKVSELSVPKAPPPPEANVLKKLPDDFGHALTPEQEMPVQNVTSESMNTGTTEESTQAAESPINDDLVVTEPDDEDASQNTKKSPSPPLDTEPPEEANDVIADIEETPPPRKHKKSEKEPNVLTVKHEEPKVKKLIKNAEVSTHKIVPIPDTIVETPKPKTTPEKTTNGLGRWTIQAGSFSKKENAVALLEKLQKQGFPVTMQAKGDIFRLKIGPELDKNRAIDMKKRLEKQNVQSLIIAE